MGRASHPIRRDWGAVIGDNEDVGLQDKLLGHDVLQEPRRVRAQLWVVEMGV